jgi:hypothetical protein
MAVVYEQRSLRKKFFSFVVQLSRMARQRGAVEYWDNLELHSSLMLGATVRTAGSCRYSLVMSTLMHRLYRCPNTGLRVQSYACIKTADGAYEVATCTICRGVHLIDPATGKVLAKASETARARPRLTVAARNS